VIAPLIKVKVYRKTMTDFIDELRVSKTFRDRQMYVIIAIATFEADNDTYKKHFAKSMASDMSEEKVQMVRILMAKLVGLVPKGYSKSTDKLNEALKYNCANGELRQFII
jgi:hypothetical protein